MPRGIPGSGKAKATRKRTSQIKYKYLAVYNAEYRGETYVEELDGMPTAIEVKDLCEEWGCNNDQLIFYKVAAKGKVKSLPVEFDWS